MKNFRYSNIFKALAVLMIWLSFAGVFYSAVFYIGHWEQIRVNDYTGTQEFMNEFNRSVRYLIDYKVKLKDEEYIKAGSTASESVSGIKPGTSTAGNTEELKKAIIEDDLNKLREAKNYIDASVNLMYIVRDKNTGNYTANIPGVAQDGLDSAIEQIKKQTVWIDLYEMGWSASSQRYYDLCSNYRLSLSSTGYEIYAAVKSPTVEGDSFFGYERSFEATRKQLPFAVGAAVLSVVAGAAFFVLLALSSGRREKRGRIYLAFIDSVYNDIHAALVLTAAFISINLLNATVINASMEKAPMLGTIPAFVLLSVDLFIGLNFIMGMIRHYKNGSLFTHTLCYRIRKRMEDFISRCFRARFFRLSVLVSVAAYGLANGILFTAVVVLGGRTLTAGLLIIAVNVASLYIAAKALLSLSSIMEWVEKISKGSLEQGFKVENISAAFKGFAADIQNIQSGLKKAVQEAVKGERLKAELITNVSHDLKTPLTSIISYVDLLKKERLDNENARSYIEILEEKSGRLKQLVEDLLEVSKAASGNVAVAIERVDLSSLAVQAAAEFSDRMDATGLDLRIKTPEEPLMVFGDGKLMWRIMENLLSNVVKYSQTGSRVYVDILADGGSGIITVKNISAVALDMPAEQLLERFVRGEESRTKEGSGLGLSIAKSLAELQGGRLDISIDGDLFKAGLSVPLAME